MPILHDLSQLQNVGCPHRVQYDSTPPLTHKTIDYLPLAPTGYSERCFIQVTVITHIPISAGFLKGLLWDLTGYLNIIRQEENVVAENLLRHSDAHWKNCHLAIQLLIMLSLHMHT